MKARSRATPSLKGGDGSIMAFKGAGKEATVVMKMVVVQDVKITRVIGKRLHCGH